jgi:hypothetical protein
METTVQELIYQIIVLFLSGLLAVIGGYVKNLIRSRIDFEKYSFENARVERIIDNAISYAEAQGKEFARDSSLKMTSTAKHNKALEYINKIDKSIVTKYSDILDHMIERKVLQKFG